MSHTRVGDCNGCSLCCRLLVLPIPRREALKRTPLGIQVPLPLLPSPDLLQFYRARGAAIGSRTLEVPLAANSAVDLVQRGRYLVARISHTCPQLTEDGQCKIHDTDDYPRACAQFPRSPDDLQDVADQCSYSFPDDAPDGER